MKIDRVAVHAKYDGHCAYCGKMITIKEMQVDHIVSKARHHQIPRDKKFDVNDFKNLNPACRMCNHYKRAESLENFRRFHIGELHKRLTKIYTVRVGIDYGIVTLKEWDKKFYFERVTI
jgi:5-methylcytosine-specific restriction endonuclease McrA